MIFPITKEDAIIHLQSLSPEEKYCRFCFTATDEYIEKYVEQAKGFFHGILDNGKCIALLHTVYYKQDNTLEVAVSVLSDYRGKRYGKVLMKYAAKLAEAYCADKILVTGLSNNSPMIALAKSCGFTMSSQFGEFKGTAETICSDIRVIVENNIKLFDLVFKPFKHLQ